MSLYIKHRPTEFQQIVGNKSVVSYLANTLDSKTRKNFPHTILLEGGTGCGKTTLARIIADKLGCKGFDLKEFNVADLRGIDTVRSIIMQAQYKPIVQDSKCRVWIIDECHMMTTDAQNAFLKLLEDTPPHVYFILCTTNANKLIKTIIGRCKRLVVEPLNDIEMRTLLRRVVKAEGKSLRRRVYEHIQVHSNGHPRNALQSLEIALSVPLGEQLEVIKKAQQEEEQSIELCRALYSKKPWREINRILRGLKGTEPESIRRHVLGYASSILLNKDDGQAAHIIEEFWEPLYDIGFPGLIMQCYATIKG